MFPIPEKPTFPPEYATKASTFLRYEDVAQDGRVHPYAINAVFGSMWRDVLMKHPGHRNATQAGVFPILTRLTILSMEQPIRVDREVEWRTGTANAYALENNEVARLYMNSWAELHGLAGKLGRFSTPGDLSLAGVAFSEHVYTKPMGPPEQRKVTRFDIEGFPAVPELRYDAPAPTTAQEAPPGATWLDELGPDSIDYVFTLDQTDSNQHINSTFYIRMFQDAVQRRLARSGKPLKVRTRAVDVAYRKPCFPGESGRASLRLFEHPEGLGAAGFIAGADEKPRCFLRILLGA